MNLMQLQNGLEKNTSSLEYLVPILINHLKQFKELDSKWIQNYAGKIFQIEMNAQEKFSRAKMFMIQLGNWISEYVDFLKNDFSEPSVEVACKILNDMEKSAYLLQIDLLITLARKTII